MKKLLHLDFIPRSVDLGLLVIRVVFGLSMLWLHGRGKLMDYSKLSGSFPDPLGVGPQLSLILAIVGELVCPALIFVGAFTRLAAIGSAATMGTAFFAIHNAQLSGPNSGEKALLFLGVFVALFISGAGKFSIDAKLGARA